MKKFFYLLLNCHTCCQILPYGNIQKQRKITQIMDKQPAKASSIDPSYLLLSNTFLLKITQQNTYSTGPLVNRYLKLLLFEMSAW